MKKIISLISILACLQLSSIAQSNYSKWNGKTWEQLDGNGKLVQLTPAVLPFNTIEANNLNLQINVETGTTESVNVTIDENLKQFFRCSQEGKTIKLFMDLSGGKYPRWLSTDHIVITIKAPAVETLVNKGNNKASVSLSDQAVFNLFADGNPNIKLNGKVNKLRLQASGNGTINAGSLLAEKVLLTSNGNSNIRVNTKELVEESVKGNNQISNLFYHPEKAAEPVNSNKEKPETISFRLKNNSLLPAKVSLVSYRPDEEGNGTNIFVMIPFGSKSFQFPEGTKLYLASSEQVNTVMSGAKISDQTPFLTVKKKDAGRLISIN